MKFAGLYWSHQHGAVIALGASALTGVLLSTEHSVWQLSAVLFSLSAFHGAELLLEGRKKRDGLSSFKSFSRTVYVATAVVSAIINLYGSSLFRFLVFPIGLLGIAAAWADRTGRKKGVGSELLSFSLLVSMGLLTYNPERQPGAEWISAWIVLTLYFGLSVFLVKLRIRRVRSWQGFVYLGLISAVYFFLLPPLQASLLVLIAVMRSVPFLIFPAWGGRWHLKSVGLTETVYVILMIMTLVMVSKVGTA